MTTDWILRCGNGTNLKNSSNYKIWGITANCSRNKHWLKKVRPGDRLWFLQNKSHGKIIAVATYRSHNIRLNGELISSLTDEELGWHDSENWHCPADIEIHYTTLYGLEHCELFTHLRDPGPIIKYDQKMYLNLPVEYSYITRYSKVTNRIK